MATAEDTPEPTTPRKDFFVSYIAWQLEEVGYTTVIQAWDFGPGSNFVLEMDRAAREASGPSPSCPLPT